MSWRGAPQKDERFAKGLLPTFAKESRAATMALDTLLNIGEPNTLHVPRAPYKEHLDTQACTTIPPQGLRGRLLAEGNIDTEADMLSGISRKRNAHSSYY